ncbi:hypothetical protein EUGRSUZ_B01216 [Eucalyptus grandis]|uniref:Uncharacterized protein n=2 Tax=Eucalyptus grandis TaxID=71139 RepID=A0ACC3LQD2_EUCGR|nr:hypothetical protein EUGRSUZ_B01216 [Eucalyptus grandis]
MATEVLRPQDCLIQRIRVSPASYPRRKACNYGNSYSNPSSRSSARPNRRQQIQQQQQPQPAKPEQQRKRYVPAQSEPSTSSRSSSDDLSKQARSSGLVMEKVTILRRGESLDSKIKSQVPGAGAGGGEEEVRHVRRIGVRGVAGAELPPPPVVLEEEARLLRRLGDQRSPEAAASRLRKVPRPKKKTRFARSEPEPGSDSLPSLLST